jgi:hypothetical protein
LILTLARSTAASKPVQGKASVELGFRPTTSSIHLGRQYGWYFVNVQISPQICMEKFFPVIVIRFRRAYRRLLVCASAYQTHFHPILQTL